MPFSKTFAPGEILTAANVNDHLLNGGYQFRETVYFTSSGTFTKATYPWLRAIRVRCVGGGGGGGGAAATAAGQHSFGDGGGGGGYSELFITDIAGLGASLTVTRGDGGSGGVGDSGGSNGTASTGFGMTANGGQGGGTRSATTTQLVVSGATVRAGATATGGALNSAGGTGESGIGIGPAITQVLGGRGGTSLLSTGSGRNVSGAEGFGGQQYGGGGQGAANPASGSARSGGNGAPGIVIVELYG